MKTFERDSYGLLERICPEMKSLLVAVVLVVGCTKPNPDACSDGNCTDPAKPFCDVNGTIGGTPDTCIAVACTANEFKECRADNAVTCNADGNNYDLIACPNGCGASGCNPPPPCTSPDCETRVVAKYLPPSVCNSITVDATPFDITSSMTFDTAGSACTSVLVQGAGAPDMCIVHSRTITIEPNVTFRVQGTRVLALVADYQLSVNGVLDISAKNGFDGPGGGGISGGPTSGAGGGGAGAASIGGSGGTTQYGGANNGGAAATDPALLTVLYGPKKADSTRHASGAATLVSCRGEVTIGGVVDANGQGGSGGIQLSSYVQPTGGGSGGTLVVQGMKVTLAGTSELWANGGGGGGGGDRAGSPPTASDGGDGARMGAGGGTGGNSSFNNGVGGYGGSSFGPPGSGGGSSTNPGAGGGAAGFLLVYAASKTSVHGSAPDAVISGITSPALETVRGLPTN